MDARGRPVVYAVAFETSADAREFKSDHEGRFLMRGVRPGTVHLAAAAETSLRRRDGEGVAVEVVRGRRAGPVVLLLER